MPTLKKLKLAIKTGSGSYAGTDSRVYLVLGTTAGGRVYLLPTNKADMETGQVDAYEIALEDGPRLEALQCVVLVNGMTGPNPGWNVLWAKLDAVDEAGHTWRLVDSFLDRWLDAKRAEGPVAVLPLTDPRVDLGTEDLVGPTRITLRSIC